MKREYVVPEVEVIIFDDGDILTSSGLILNIGSNAVDNEGVINVWGDSSFFSVDSDSVKNIKD